VIIGLKILKIDHLKIRAKEFLAFEKDFFVKFYKTLHLNYTLNYSQSDAMLIIKGCYLALKKHHHAVTFSH